ncbi:MAG: PDZ domain-containing protein [Rhodospirillales bacterium]|nr:PDZ domain-containing protein [Rhodospirillales bacterium]
MIASVTTPLSRFSDAMGGIVARAAHALATIRLGPDRQRSGFLWQPDIVVTAEAGLPALDACSVLRPEGSLLPGRLARRDAGSGLAAIRLDAPASTRALSHAAVPEVSTLVVLIATTAEAGPSARLAMVRDGAADGRVALDTALDADQAGGPVLDASGHLVGVALAGADGNAAIAPVVRVAGLLGTPVPARVNGPRGWIGLSLQPVEGSGRFRWLGAGKGRRVIGMYAGGPGAQAGIMVGDVLLTLDGTPISGSGALRDYLSPERVGQTIDVRLMREGHVRSVRILIAPQPEGL